MSFTRGLRGLVVDMDYGLNWFGLLWASRVNYVLWGLQFAGAFC